jgi:hypothetical protein
MTTKAKPPPRAAALGALEEGWAGPWTEPPWTMEERLERIRALGQRIDAYVRFMCQVGGLGGTSAEAKEHAVTAFYERLVVAEGQLGRVQEDLRLG